MEKMSCGTYVPTLVFQTIMTLWMITDATLTVCAYSYNEVADFQHINLVAATQIFGRILHKELTQQKLTKSLCTSSLICHIKTIFWLLFACCVYIATVKLPNHVSCLLCLRISNYILFFDERNNRYHFLKFLQYFLLADKKSQVLKNRVE